MKESGELLHTEVGIGARALLCCERNMPRRGTISIVGAGKLGSALALSLHESGFKIHEIISRGTPASRRVARSLARKVDARATTVDDPKTTAGIVWICVPDREIAPCARDLAASVRDWKGRVVLHASGALTSDELQVLRRRGAKVASAHPLMTFVHGAQPTLEGVGFAVEGDRAAVKVVREIVSHVGGEFFSIAKKHKVAYHTWATFASPLVTALLAMAEEVAASAGVARAEARRRMMPILRETLSNYALRGPAAGFSGAIIRGDAQTIGKHLQALKKIPGAGEVYRALARAALSNLPAGNRKVLNRTLRS